MAGSNVFKQKCVCGSEIEIGEQFEFISMSSTRKLFEDWRQQHAKCLPLFQRVQQVRLAQIERKLIGGG